MLSNANQKKVKIQKPSPPHRSSKEYKAWEELVEEQIKNDTLKSRTCKAYSTNEKTNISEKTRCICGRLTYRHSFTGESEIEYQNAQKWRPKLSCVVNVTVYGQLMNGARVCSY